jgi:hypothetical protein
MSSITTVSTVTTPTLYVNYQHLLYQSRPDLGTNQYDRTYVYQLDARSNEANSIWTEGTITKYRYGGQFNFFMEKDYTTRSEEGNLVSSPLREVHNGGQFYYPSYTFRSDRFGFPGTGGGSFEFTRKFAVNHTVFLSYTDEETRETIYESLTSELTPVQAATQFIMRNTNFTNTFSPAGITANWINTSNSTIINNRSYWLQLSTPLSDPWLPANSFTINVYQNSISSKGNLLSTTTFHNNKFRGAINGDGYPSWETLNPSQTNFFSLPSLSTAFYFIELQSRNLTGQITSSVTSLQFYTEPINSVQINSLNTSSLVASWDGGVSNSQTLVLFQGSTSIHTFRSVTSGDTLSVDTLVTPGYSYAVQVSVGSFTSTQSAATSLVCRRPELVNMDSWFSNTSFRYTFTPSLGATSYPLILYTGTTSNLTTNSTVVGTYTGVPFPNTTTNFITPTTLTTGNFYAFRVGAGNSAGIAYSTLSYPIRYSPPLTSITNVSISKLTDAEIRVSWSGGNNSVNNVVTLFSSVDRVTNEIVKNYYSVTSGVTDLSIQTGPGVYYTAQVYAEDLIGNKVLSTLSSYTQHRSTKPEIPVITRITEKDITVQSVNTFQNIPQRIILYERDTPFGSFVADKTAGVSNITSFPVTIPFTNAVGSLNVGPIPGKYYSAVAQTLVGTGNTSFVSEQTTPATLFISPPTSMTTYSIATLSANSVVFTYVGGLSAQSVTVNLHASSDGQANTISTRTTFNTSAVSHLPSYRNTLTFNTALSRGFYAVSFIAYNNFGSLSTSVSNFQALL